MNRGASRMPQTVPPNRWWPMRWSFWVAMLGGAVAAGAIFAIYEVVERTALVGTDPRLVYYLHLLRGLTAAMVAMMVALWIIWRDGENWPAELPAPPAIGWLAQRIQRVKLRTKIVVPMLVLAMGPSLAIGTFTITRAESELRQNVVRQLQFDTAAKARSIQDAFARIKKDLQFLAQMSVLSDWIDASAEEKAAADYRQRVERELALFAHGRWQFADIRLSERAGHAAIWITLREGIPRTVPQQWRAHFPGRPTAGDENTLQPGEVFVSTLHPTHGTPGTFPNGGIHFATPVFGHSRKATAMLEIEIGTQQLVTELGSLPAGNHAWLIDEWGNRFDCGTTPLPNRVPAPAADWVFAEPVVIEGNLNRVWYFSVARPSGEILSPVRQLTAFFLVGMLMVLSVAALLGVFVAHYLIAPVIRLRNAAREIANGDLSKHVAIHTGDELEQLADDFNTMTDKLRDSRDRLASWNEQLENKLARQAEYLSTLQTGLARADKLASIGQMTASVLHEVGNPLAAIKTSIQVSQDELECAHCVMKETILQEVNRLAGVLRSFSRLSRLDTAERSQVELGAIVQDVAKLVASEIRRRRIRLETQLPDDSLWFNGNADQLRQLLINLVLNAADACAAATETDPAHAAQITVRLWREAVPEADETAVALLAVSDTGIGMSADVLARIWEPFFTTKREGTGLGLAICQKIVRDNDGTIDIRSEPGQGTTITVRLPIRPESADEDEPWQSAF